MLKQSFGKHKKGSSTAVETPITSEFPLSAQAILYNEDKDKKPELFA
jgi:hypothetical protein